MTTANTRKNLIKCKYSILGLNKNEKIYIKI